MIRALVTRPRRVICHLLHGLGVGGAEVLAAGLARRLRDEYDFLFVCLDELGTLGEQLRSEGFEVAVMGRRPGFDWQCSLRINQFLTRRCVDLVHAHQYTGFFYGAAGRLFSRRPRLVFTEHGRLQPDYPRPKRIFANRLLLGRRDRVISVGEAVRQALIVNEGIPPVRIEVIRNGIDVDRFAEVSGRNDARGEIGVGVDDFVVLQVARLDRLKDHATALRAVNRLRCVVANARLVIVGEGPERAWIESQIDELAMRDHVRLLGLRTDVARLLPGADAVMLTSISEGIPLAVIEGMAARLPVVATEVGGVGEVVEHGVTGLLAPAGDDGALAEHLARLAHDPELRRSLGDSGQARAARLFSAQEMDADYRRLYEEMLGG